MPQRKQARRVAASLLMVALGSGCRRSTPATVTAGTSPVTQAGTSQAAPTTNGAASRPTMVAFGGAKLGITVEYPGAWASRPTTDYELLIVPPEAAPGRSISLDVPDLPIHIPGLIPMGSVQSGYVDDVKKQFGQVQVSQLPAPSLGKSSVRLVRCTGHSGKQDWVDIALLVVHADRVYILRASTDAAGEADVRATLDAMIRSIRWVKP